MHSSLPDNWQQKATAHKKDYEQYLKRANKREIIKKLPAVHEQAFTKVDCLDCGACCKNYSPRFTGPDIRRIAKHLRLKETEIISTYLQADEDGDFVLRSKPCPFLGDDNYCGIYEHRPTDCRRFPYTDEDVLLKKPKITIKNSSFCPAVYMVLEHLLEGKDL